jgi:hypothetical protein
MRWIRLSGCLVIHPPAEQSYSRLPWPAGRWPDSNMNKRISRSPQSRATENLIASHQRSLGRRGQPVAYPRLQNSCSSASLGSRPSCPGAQHRPLQPLPKGSRAGCSQRPSSSLCSGKKYGHGTDSISPDFGNDAPLYSRTRRLATGSADNLDADLLTSHPIPVQVGLEIPLPPSRSGEASGGERPPAHRTGAT